MSSINYSFKDWCEDNGKLDYLKLWNEELNNCSTSEIAAKSNKKYYFDCPRGLHKPHAQMLSTITRNSNLESLICRDCKSFEQWCLDNNHQDYLDLWDYELNDKNPSEVSYATHNSYWFKCNKSLHSSELKRIANVVFQGFSCRKCNSFGQYLIDVYGDDAIGMYWSDENKCNPFDLDFSSLTKALICCEKDGTHGSYEVTCANFVNGNRCPICSGKKVVYGINSICDTNKDVVVYFKDKSDTIQNTRGSRKRVRVVCPDCSNESYMEIANLCNRGFSCKVCSDGLSLPHKIMLNVLLLQDISNLTTEFTEEWCVDSVGSKRKYDFYFEKYGKKYIIEMDGAFHYKDNNMSSQSLEDSMRIDAEKDAIATNKGISVIRVNCNYDVSNDRFEYIKANILKQLSNILELGYLNWDSIYEKSLNSMMIRSIKMWNSNKYVSTTEIAKELMLDRHTVRNYLTIGKKLNMCEYNGEEHSRSNLTDGSKFRKAVAVYDVDKNYIKTFESLTNLCEVSIQELGINLSPQYVRNVCCGKKESHRGYIFEYVKKEDIIPLFICHIINLFLFKVYLLIH